MVSLPQKREENKLNFGGKKERKLNQRSIRGEEGKKHEIYIGSWAAFLAFFRAPARI